VSSKQCIDHTLLDRQCFGIAAHSQHRLKRAMMRDVERPGLAQPIARRMRLIAISGMDAVRA
jgi:hypothetical protein